LLNAFYQITFFQPLELHFLPPEVFFLQYTDFTMHSLIPIVGVVLNEKENYLEWSRKIKHTLIFNELWKGVCVGERDNEPAKTTLDNEISIWENKNSKTYALIAAFVNE